MIPKRLLTILTGLMLLLLVPPPALTFGADNSESSESSRQIQKIKIISFYTNDNELVTGRLISQDKNKLTVAKIEGSLITTSTYGTRDINAGTRMIQTVTELEYYQEMGDYFADRTGDFLDDPDDFIQAIRYYEKARELANSNDKYNSKLARELEDKITRLKADRKVWAEEVQSRANLKELEFKATFDNRLDDLKIKIEQQNKKFEQLETDVNQIKDNITQFDQNVSWEINRILGEMTTVREAMDAMMQQRNLVVPPNLQLMPPMYPQQYYYPYYYYYQGSGSNFPSNQPNPDQYPQNTPNSENYPRNTLQPPTEGQ
ncbi:MAG: hypothetical protein JW860_15920 [Sedimentisphaerales bacterium]|nr:hypothetical protein [Sedimentisphaerales bacterium]